MIGAAAVAAAVLSVALFGGSTPGREPTAQTVDRPPAAEAAKVPAARTIRFTGSVAAAESVVLRAPYLRGNRSRGGGAADFNTELAQLAEPGRRVRAGEIVAVFDNENMRNRLDNDEADVAEAQGVVNKIRADQAAAFEAHRQKIREARAALERAKLDLQTARVRSAIQAQQFQLALEEAEATVAMLTAQTRLLQEKQAAELRAAELDLRRATVDARSAKANLDRLTVRAPMAGLLVAEQIYRNGQLGEVRQGDQVRSGQPYLRIAELSRMIVEATANQVDVTDIRLGEPVKVRFDAYPDLEMPGRIEGIGAMARASGMRPSFVADVPVTISLQGSDPRVIPGLTVSVEINVDLDIDTN